MRDIATEDGQRNRNDSASRRVAEAVRWPDHASLVATFSHTLFCFVIAKEESMWLVVARKQLRRDQGQPPVMRQMTWNLEAFNSPDLA